jgi:hypothetical protein
MTSLFILGLFALAPTHDAALPPFRQVVVDGQVGIGYGVAVADVDGDGKPDLLLVDKEVVAWYRNPGWEKSILARKLTPIDHVCLAARDLDGDGKAEIAAGAGWNPSDTLKSGSVHYLIPPADRRQLWEPVELPHEPTVHRMRWLHGPGGSWSLVVAPLHGRGNDKEAQGAGARVLAYRKPADPRKEWATEVVDDSLHVIHNLEIVDWDGNGEEEVLLAAREGVFHYRRGSDKWNRTQLAGKGPGSSSSAGAGEVRTGRLPGGKRFLATIEPFHGNRVAVYRPPSGGELSGLWTGFELDSTLNGGHALACGDLLGLGSDQVAAGWRLKDSRGKVGIRVYVPLDAEGTRWESALLDDNTMACEDLTLADLDGDGRLDLIAAGRDTHNLKIYFNGGAKPVAK